MVVVGRRCGRRRARWDLMKFPSLLVTEPQNGEEIDPLGKRFIFSKSKIRNLPFSNFLLELLFFSFRFLVFDSTSLTSHADCFSSFSLFYHPISKSPFLFHAQSLPCVRLSWFPVSLALSHFSPDPFSSALCPSHGGLDPCWGEPCSELIYTLRYVQLPL